ncbi:hypothetical protein M9Y10_022932 [Tritrichomonas musculus]|uniref:Uncharacterized protein n=1 Tax=Tritrichomonas musculus TaxID=1915356 RepID=A0ABR2KUK7_9EUKA
MKKNSNQYYDQESPNINSNNSGINDMELPKPDIVNINSLRVTAQRTRSQISSLESQLTRIEKVNAKLNNDLMNIQNRNKRTEKEAKQIQQEIDEVNAKIKECEEIQSQKTAEYEKSKSLFEEEKNKASDKINNAKTQNATLQHDLSKQVSLYKNLESSLSQKENEIVSLTSEISRYNDQSVNFNNEKQNDSNSNMQLSILENEVTRLQERLNKILLKITQLEDNHSEIESNVQSEINEMKKKKTEIEQELFVEKEETVNLNRILNEARSASISNRESAEIEWKNKIEEQKNLHLSNINKLKQSHSNSAKNNQSGENLIQALATIEALKSENTTLELMIDSKNKNSNEKSGEIYLDFGRNSYLNSRSPRMKNLTSLFPSNFNDNNVFFQFVDQIDSYFLNVVNYINSNPKIRLLLIVWILFSILFAIKLLF